MSLPLWVDCDNALGAPFSDVDDGLALLWLLAQPGLALRGVGTVHGNAPLAAVHARTARLIAGTGTPLHRGAARPGEGGTAAAAALRHAVAAEEGRLVVLALGPLTNLAAAEQAAPGLLGRCAAVVALGGALGRHRLGWRPVRELNIAADPEAARLVLRAAPRLTVIPATSCLALTLGWGELGRLRPALRGPVALWLAACLAGRLSPRMVAWDMVGALAVACPGLLRTRPTTLACHADGRLEEAPGARHTLVEGLADPAAARAAMLEGLR